MRTTLRPLVIASLLVACSSPRDVTAPESQSLAATVTAPAHTVAPPASSKTTAVPVGGQAAQQADVFVSSIGINVHLTYLNTIYDQGFESIIKPRIEAAGIRYIRTGGDIHTPTSQNGWMSEVYGRVNELNAAGVKADLIMSPEDGGTNYSTVPLSRLLQFVSPDAIDSFEGLNEMDYPATYPNWVAETRSFQQALFSAVRGNSQVSGVKVVGPALSHWETPAAADEIGSVTSMANIANMHPYPGGQTPLTHLATSITNLKAMNGNMPYEATETGYHTDEIQANGFPGVSDLAASRYIPRLFLEYWLAGIQRTYAYELVDAIYLSSSTIQAHFGLLNGDGSPKLAYTAMKNLIGILADPGASFTPGSLSYALSSLPTTVHRALFERRSGHYFLVLWNDVSVYNTSSMQDVTPAGVSAKLTLPSVPKVLNSYLPASTNGPHPLTPSTTVTLSIPAEPLVIEIEL